MTWNQELGRSLVNQKGNKNIFYGFYRHTCYFNQQAIEESLKNLQKR